MMMSISLYSAIFFLVIVGGYIIQSLLLQYIFYCRASRDVAKWKNQPSLTDGVGAFWGLPLVSSKPNRQPYHRLFTTWNLFMAGLFAGGTAELCIRGQCRMRDLGLSWADVDVLELVLATAGCVVYESVVEYYWHRLMHLRFFYATFHKFHHSYKAPEVWDDMMIHPLEAFGYYIILYAPPFIFPIRLLSFLAYMVVMGLCGVIDHSGINIRIGIYHSADHDIHHEKFIYNYGFPFMILDYLHGTFLDPVSCPKKRH